MTEPPDTEATLRVLDWNLNGWTPDRTEAKLDLLGRLEWDVATLQELTSSSMKALRTRFPDWDLVARDARPALKHPERLFRCGILIRPPVELVREVDIPCDGDQGLPGIESPVPPEILVGADIRLGSTPLTVVSAHPPHSAGDEDWRLLRKLRTYAVLNRWLGERDDMVIGMDSNTWLDHQPYDPVTWAEDHPQALILRFFFADPPEHNLRDALRVWLQTHRDQLHAIKARRPAGPLALTHVRGGNRIVGDRFDVILVPQHARVKAIEHNYEDAVAAGSDHAYVLAIVGLN